MHYSFKLHRKENGELQISYHNTSFQANNCVFKNVLVT